MSSMIAVMTVRVDVFRKHLHIFMTCNQASIMDGRPRQVCSVFDKKQKE
jgi:hypothetical protein